MRRALLAVALGGVLLTATACDSDTESPAAAPAAGFGAQMGKMIAHKEAKQTAEAEKAEKAAAAGLKNIAVKVKKEIAAAEDPELKTAGEASAAKFAQSAADDKFFDSIKTTKDLDRTIEGKMTDWLSPVAGYCA